MYTSMFEVIEKLQQMKDELVKEDGIELMSFNLQSLIDTLEQEQKEDEEAMVSYYEKHHPELFEPDLVAPISVRGLQ